MPTIMIKYPIGIDMSGDHVAAAQLQRPRNGSSIRALSYHETGEADPDDGRVMALLEGIAEDPAFTGRTVVLSIPAIHLSIFPLLIQIGKQETLEDAILRESEKYLPFPVEEAVIDYACLTRESEGAADRYKATIVAARQGVVNNYLELLNRAGFVVSAVDFAVSALLRLHQSLYAMTANPVILCHIGPLRTLIAAVTADSIIIQSDVAWGSRQLVNRILSDIDLSGDRTSARVLLRKYGVGGEVLPAGPAEGDPETADVGKTVARILVPHIDEIQYELHKIISYVRAEKQSPVFDGLFLYGRAADVRYLDRYLEKRMDMPAVLVDPLASMAPDRDEVLPNNTAAGAFAFALGLAMRRMPWL